MGGKNSPESINRYMAKAYDRINILVPKGRKDTIKAHAEGRGESMSGFINRAIDQTIKRDTTGGPSEVAGAHLGEGAISSIPPTTIKTAREAAEAAGEELPVFVTRAVETQAQRDSITRKMKKAPDKKSEA